MDIQNAAKLLGEKLLSDGVPGVVGTSVLFRNGPYSTTVPMLCVDINFGEINQISDLHRIPKIWHTNKVYFRSSQPKFARKDK
ncbi:hypothetical protein A2W54_03690 [Candidatus Giovannonibacteria bacterium RIFCSPHIGHO2_02_43_13]|uniref:Uncharacterized protein n=1 Tax=Candidatus Giovannonibacteria bacterium RIFCSPHIGHO2_02_43_13 TaxID=1798330 RepID=A0A1F5WRC5_9BACT|nr:MAG: hypothetical protein UW28_C0043G0005 [Parcubacteria group bacterium GW2011_GWA2_44_13]OGF74623.1 MAG: hypothetical protein A3E06_02790 [Candidatus Giovannonibacteria bacterium RIFCSPHIGHO2_12_FULL_44_42]OGF78180.1 MAG: hypothetical protein A2W54_03690 [Candidatus Giovannonibacteria bacterium RIFCSPHIGHO2_02_43_13]OGF89048.1 MAG: hypothetical protein A3I94_01850 [Candidatus Giovannonibacteria bacterium RIFCSPLOWO2_02_FULL_43_54]OGF96909.1 MAG: hypothetical protein A3H08_02865 [Candidatus